MTVKTWEIFGINISLGKPRETLHRMAPSLSGTCSRDLSDTNLTFYVTHVYIYFLV
jgi:hypothetical protein